LGPDPASARLRWARIAASETPIARAASFVLRLASEIADKVFGWSSMDDTAQVLLRFNRLIRDLENGSASRNSFRPWEVELLLDMQDCHLGADRKRVLRRYQKAFHRCLERGATRPLMLSEYLMRSRRCGRASAA
jgi:hypothetical protein